MSCHVKFVYMVCIVCMYVRLYVCMFVCTYGMYSMYVW